MSARLFIDGGPVASDGDLWIDVVDPTTLLRVGRVPDGTTGDVDRAVRAADRAFREGEWAALDSADRAHLLERIADELESRGEELAQLVTSEMGQPISLSRVMNGVVPAHHFRYYAQALREADLESRRDNVAFPGESIIRREAMGVAALIVPWNYPISLLTAKLAPALAAGCTVVIKPAAETPLDALVLAEAVTAAGLPPGVVNVVTGGRRTGEALVAHPGVRKVAFTGSTAAGRAIAQVCGGRLVPATLELGGKSAAIVLDDADLDETIGALRDLSFMNSGQTCFLLSRVLAPTRRVDEVTERLAAAARSLVLGDPRDPRTEQGPLVSERILGRVVEMVDRAAASGAVVATGGSTVAGVVGHYYQPTVLTGVDASSPIAQDEIFGPVVTVLGYDDDDEAVRLADATRYGLGGAVFSSDPARALGIARRVQTGTIGINKYSPDLAIPFGGYKDSGLGREQGPEAIANFLTTKAIYL
jgi:betaine-aldehyde dehydrogenase